MNETRLRANTEPSCKAHAGIAYDRVKLNMRIIRIGGYTYRILTLRPATKVAFSTNFFHQTWHIVSSQGGARLLARLFWGLSYARVPGTVIMIHGEHILPTPFEAERSDPVLLAPDGLTRLNEDDLRILRGRLARLEPPTGTVRLHTFGLDRALREAQDAPRQAEHEGEWLQRKANRRVWRQERMRRLGGFICYSAPSAVMRLQALRINSLRVQTGKGVCEMDYQYIAEASSRDSWVDGEVQIFVDYKQRVRAAVEARMELVANPKQPVISETIQEAISRRRDQIMVRRK